MSMSMKREHILIPTPKSMFLLVQCPKCNTERVIYSHTTMDIRCNNCGKLLAENTGGKAIIYGKVISRVDQVSAQQS